MGVEAKGDLEAELDDNLAWLGWLGQRIAQTDCASRRREFLREFGRALARRLAVIEVIVAPVLANGPGDAAGAARACHARLRGALAEVLGCAGDEAACSERQLGFVRQATLELAQQQAALLPRLRARLPPAHVAALAARARAQLRSPLA